MIRTITDLTNNDINMKNVINSYDCNINQINLQLKNMGGLTNTIYVAVNNMDELVNIILPVWTTAQTITIHNDFYPIVKRELKKYKILSKEDINNLSICVMYGINVKELKLGHLATVKLSDFIKRGGNGENNISRFMHVKEIPKNIKMIFNNKPRPTSLF